jgi:hypothetical protein
MNTLIHADIFFFVTTIAVVVVALFLTIALIYLIRVLNQIQEIGKEIKEEAVLIRGDINELRNSVKREGFRLQSIFSFFKNLFNKKILSRSKKNK